MIRQWNRNTNLISIILTIACRRIMANEVIMTLLSRSLYMYLIN